MTAHDVETCEICGPIVSSPAYEAGVERAAMVMLNPEGALSAVNLVERLAAGEPRKDIA